MSRKQILVLGSYGLAGRAIVAALLRNGEEAVIASGRRQSRLEEQFAAQRERVETRVLDAADAAELRTACASVGLVINAVGPFNRGGAEIARTVVESGCHYVDCANEQIHYERLRGLHDAARAAGVLMVTGAGLIPGLSTLLAVDLLDRDPATDGLDIVYAQLRHAYPDGGRASVMGGVLDAIYRPFAVHRGVRTPVTLGHSTRQVALPAPFGPRRVLEVPTIDVAVLAERTQLREIHTWFYLGDQPTWLFGLIRFLNPAERPWAYRLVDRVVERMARGEFARAAKKGLGPDALLMVQTSSPSGGRGATVHLNDGATPTAVLPARIARDLSRGRIERRGLATPPDLYRWGDVVEDLTECVLRVEMNGAGDGEEARSPVPLERPIG